jgi:predicted methyltransferase
MSVALVTAACGAPADDPPASPAPAPADSPAVSLDRAALADPARPETERAQDEHRKPLEVYEFFGVQPGQVVADVYASAGYNTHLLSRLVGEGGRVYSVLEFYGDASLFEGQLYMGDAVSQRIADAGLENVDLVMRMAEVPAASVDVAMAIRNYHDVEWMIEDWKRAEQLAEMFRIVKPGGVVGIVEVATPEEGWDEVAHRLNKQVVIDDFVGIGFELVGESDILANPDDDYSVDGFPDRWTTDRYVLKFRKPRG